MIDFVFECKKYESDGRYNKEQSKSNTQLIIEILIGYGDLVEPFAKIHNQCFLKITVFLKL
jgi:hypothetical protein